MIRTFIVKLAKVILKYFQPSKYVSVEVKTITLGSILQGKNIVITGGGRGIGFAMAKKFVSEGANVLISGRNEDTLRNAIKQLGGNSKYIVYDVTDTKSSFDFIHKCQNSFGEKIDCLVSNAGISYHESSIINVTEEGFDKQFNTNLKSCYFLCQAFLRDFQRSNHSEANLLIVSSETADLCYDIPYGMTKAGLNTLTRALSRRYYSNGIRVNAIAPGVTLSDMTKYAKSDDGNMSRNCAAGRVFLPEEVAEVACFLLSDASKCISGEIIHTNAGNHLRAFWD